MSGLSRLRPDWRFSMNAVPVTGGRVQADFDHLDCRRGACWRSRASLGQRRHGLARRPGGGCNGDGTGGARAWRSRVRGAGDAVRAGRVRGSERTRDDCRPPIPARSRLPIFFASIWPRASGNRCCSGVDQRQEIGWCRRGVFNSAAPSARISNSRPAPDTKVGTARLLDKSGEPLTVPVAAGERLDAQTGQRWLTADITLAALGAGDYVIEFTTGEAAAQKKVLTAIRSRDDVVVARALTPPIEPSISPDGRTNDPRRQ